MRKPIHNKLEMCAFDVPNYLEAGNCHVVIKHISREAN